MEHLVQDPESGLLRDKETGHLAGIEQKPVIAMPATEFPKWKFRLVEDDEGKKKLESVLIEDSETEEKIGSDWSDSRAELLKGTEMEHARVHEHVVHVHHLVKPEEVVVENEVDHD